MQLLGIAAVVLILPVATWGWRLMTHRPLYRERIRLLFWIGGAVLAAAFASCLPRSAAWALPAGLGGVVGDSLLKVPAFILGGSLNGIAAFAIAAVTGAVTLYCIAIAAGFAWGERKPEPAPVAADEDEDDEKRSWI
jgi:S-DNA-T family DNA segregation ATPase FtsK/SpoIIIE